MDKREFLRGTAAVGAAMILGGMDEEAMAGTTVPRTNWAGNYHYSTDKVFEPATVGEVQDAVRFSWPQGVKVTERNDYPRPTLLEETAVARH